MSKNIDLRSDEINELLGTPPRWIIRGGIGVIFSVVLLLFIGSIFFRYPEVINAPVVITTENPPAMVSARATGRLSLLKVVDGAAVNKGDTLAIVQNPAAVSSIRRLKGILEGMSSFFENYDTPLLPSFSEPLQLGEVQTSYAALVRAADDYRIFVEQGFYPKKMEALGRERKEYGLYYIRLDAQLNIMKMDMRIASKQFRRDSTLFSMKNISASDYEKAEQLLLSKKYSLEQSKVSLSDASITMHTYTDSVNPMFSKLIFYNSTDTTEDGYLNAYEVYNMRIKARLAILSACRSGDGNLVKGEGLMSIARGFRFAGCPSLVVTQWRVDDYSGGEVIKNFAKNLKRGYAKSDAMRIAQLSFLATADPLRSHPYFWAGYQVVGEDTPLFIPVSMLCIPIIILLIVLAQLFLSTRLFRRFYSLR
jgi:Uncharacterized protein conserved in bacteria